RHGEERADGRLALVSHRRRYRSRRTKMFVTCFPSGHRASTSKVFLPGVLVAARIMSELFGRFNFAAVGLQGRYRVCLDRWFAARADYSGAISPAAAS